MAKAIITLKVMPESPDVDMDKLKETAETKIREFAGETTLKTEEEPIAFGLKALNIIFTMDESEGSTEPIEKSLGDAEGVNSVEITDVRRALG